MGLASFMLLHQAGRWSGLSAVVRRAAESAFGSWQKTWVAGCAASMFILKIAGFDVMLSLESNPGGLVQVCVGGFLIGFGSKIGCGCTSGHGVMGVPRFSLRSIVATCTFMATAILTATYFHTSLLLDEGSSLWTNETANSIADMASYAVIAGAVGSVAVDVKRHARAAATTFVAGITFGLGLHVSGMTRASKLLNFLDISPLLKGDYAAWDPTMLVVMATAMAFNIVTFNFWLLPEGTQGADGKDAAIPGMKNCLPTKSKVTTGLVAGAALFGVGFGLSGVCVGPTVAQIFKGGVAPYVSLAAVLEGQLIAADVAGGFIASLIGES